MGGVFLIFLVTISPVQASVVPDNTLPNNSIVKPKGNIRIIQGGTLIGKNLFHSFKFFSFAKNIKAQFRNDKGAQNIIARVTGGSASNINGTIKTSGKANLFLINPNGIIFGPKASLDIGGSFLASTASSLTFADETQFSAIAPQASPLLTMSAPIGLQFKGNEAALRLHGSKLQVKSGRTLSLVGGDVEVHGGTLQAPAGQIELGGVEGSGTVGLNFAGKNLRLSFPDGVARAEVLLNKSSVDVSGTRGGSVAINAENLLLRNSSMTSNTDKEKGKGIFIEANGSVHILKSVLTSQTTGSGKGGDIQIKSGSIFLARGAGLNASSFGKGNGGNVILKAGDTISIKNSSNILSQAGESGNAGSILVQAGHTVSFSNKGGISSNTFKKGKGGDIQIKAERISLTDGAILTSNTAGAENAGGVFLQADKTILISGSVITAVAQSETGPNAKGGSINIKTHSFSLANGARLDVNNFGQGDAGNIQIDSDLIKFNNGKLIAKTTSGKGGNIMLRGRDIQLRNNSRISTTASTSGNGGNISINAETLVGLENSDIVANANEGKGGLIQITSQGIFGLKVREELTKNSDITAFSEKAPQLNGEIKVNTPDTDPSRELVTLPTEVVDATGLITQNCSATGAGAGASKFIVTGRGGLPPTAQAILRSDPILEDLGPSFLDTRNHSGEIVSTHSARSTHLSHSVPVSFLEAQGWIIGPHNQMILTAQAPTVTPSSSWPSPASCNGS